MIADSDIVPECLYGPESFGGLMALYESNYLLLKTLMRSADLCVTPALKSVSDNDEILYLDQESATRYTQILRLTYIFDEEQGMVADPDLRVRVYHDARMTEVLTWAGQHRHQFLQDLHAGADRQLNKCWRKNMVLSKWLNYLLENGHRFDHQVVAVSGAAEHEASL